MNHISPCTFHRAELNLLDWNTSVLSRVQAFLPELAASNADLARRSQQDPRSVDIENVDSTEERYIEMVCLTFPL